MKSLNISNKLGGALFFSCALLLGACTPEGRTDSMANPKSEVVNEIDAERAAMENDLLDLRDRIDGRINEVDHRLAVIEIDDDQLAELRLYRDELQDRRNLVERARRDIDGSSADNWSRVRTATQNTADDINDWVLEQANRVEAVIDPNVEIEDDPNLDE